MGKSEISKLIEEMKPIWNKYIVDLGYTEKQGKKFAEGYTKEISKSSESEKAHAINKKYGPCMTAGFNNAGINEFEARQKDTKIRMQLFLFD
jgi:hypothetical protein